MFLSCSAGILRWTLTCTHQRHHLLSGCCHEDGVGSRWLIAKRTVRPEPIVFPVAVNDLTHNFSYADSRGRLSVVSTANPTREIRRVRVERFRPSWTAPPCGAPPAAAPPDAASRRRTGCTRASVRCQSGALPHLSSFRQMREATSRVSDHVAWLRDAGVDITSLAAWREGESRRIEAKILCAPRCRGSLPQEWTCMSGVRALSE